MKYVIKMASTKIITNTKIITIHAKKGKSQKANIRAY